MANSDSVQITLFGRLDDITPDDTGEGGTATGWCWSPQAPDRHREVRLVAGDKPLATVRCNEPRPVLLSMGVGDGAHGFTVRVPRNMLPPAAGSVAVHLEDVETGQRVGPALAYNYGPATQVVTSVAPGLAPFGPTLRAVLERVEEEGLVRGWCWSPSEPSRRVRLLILVDNQPVGVAVADILRNDLKDAGIGDGGYGFQFLLPWDAVCSKSSCQITLADEATGRMLPAATLFRRPSVRPIEERLRELEHQVRLLNARLDEAGRRSDRDAQMVSAMLATIGAFFTRLSETTLESIPTALVPSLTDLVDRTRERLPPLTLALVSDPELTLVIDASGTMDGIYACLRSIHTSGLDKSADVVLIDDGSVTEAALFPALVQNLRYWRLPPGQSTIEARNRIAALTPHQPIAFLSASTRLNAEWWPALRATFAREPLCAVLCTKLVRADGFVEAAGLLPDPRGQLTDFAEARHEHDPAIDMLQPVTATTDAAILIDGAAFAALGGFDVSFIDPAAAAVAFCITCWDKGRSVLYQPSAALRWQNECVRPTAARTVADPDIAEMLAHRWFATPRAAWPVPVGDALLIDAPGPDAPSDPACPGMAAALRQLGWRVSVGVIGRLEREDARAPLLRSLGVQVLRAPFDASVGATLEASGRGLGLIQLSGAAARALPPARIRTLSPDAVIILCLDGPCVPPDFVRPDFAPPDWLRDAVAASNCTFVSDARLAASLATHTQPAKVRRLATLHRPGYAQRAGIGLILPTEFAAARAALTWFTRFVWPRLRHALPGALLHVREQDAEAAPTDAVLHPAEHYGPNLWRGLRLAVAPSRKAQPGEAMLQNVLQAGLPVYACGAVWPSLPAGAMLGASTPRNVIREISLLYGDPTRWQTLHDSMDDPALTADEWLLGFRALLGAFKLPMSPSATKLAACASAPPFDHV